MTAPGQAPHRQYPRVFVYIGILKTASAGKKFQTEMLNKKHIFPDVGKNKNIFPASWQEQDNFVSWSQYAYG